jgi:hypothetical protein
MPFSFDPKVTLATLPSALVTPAAERQNVHIFASTDNYLILWLQ